MFEAALAGNGSSHEWKRPRVASDYVIMFFKAEIIYNACSCVSSTELIMEHFILWIT